MTTFLEIQFPPQISYGAQGGPQFLTRINSTQSGKEYRKQAWGRRKGLWNVSTGLKSAADWATLLDFFHIAEGRTFGFRFKDWLDYLDNGRGVLALNSVSALQLAKAYTISGHTFTRFIDKPVSATVVLSGTGTVSYTTGLITAGGAPGDTWTGEFDTPARFDTDHLDMTAALPDTAVWDNIPVIEIPL